MSRTAPGPDGFLVIDKPTGMTSHDLVARARRALGTRRVGHAGTLDPMASGLLVLGVGRGTRLLTYVVGANKEYLATIRFGVATSTEDAEGEVIGRAEIAQVNQAGLRAAMDTLTGAIMQIPSTVSAIKVQGKRAYARVRAGEEVVLAARPVQVDEFTLLRLGEPSAQGSHVDCDVRVACGSGTYVRALARDLGLQLGTLAHLTALRRTRVGDFTLDDAHDAHDFTTIQPGDLMPLGVAAARCLPVHVVSTSDRAHLVHGRSILAQARTGTGPLAAIDESGALIAVVEQRDGTTRQLHPSVVFVDAGLVSQ